MRYSIPAAIASLLVLSAAPAAGQEVSPVDSGFYLSVHALASNSTAKNDPTETEYQMDYGYGGIAAIGYAAANPGYGVNFRFEIEASYRTYELSEITDVSTFVCGGVTFCLASGNYNIASAMANMYFDFSTGSAVLPSIGIGYGRARHYFEDWVINGVPLGDSDADTDIFQIMAGIGYQLTPGLIVDTEYRYVQPNNNSFNGFFSNEITIGLRLIL